MVFESRNVLYEGGEVQAVLCILLHSLGREPGNGISGDVMVFEGSVELRDKISESSEGEQGARDGTLAEGRGPSEGRPLSHVGESKGDLLLVGVIDSFVNEEVELHGMQPVHGFVIGSIKRFRDADA